MKKIINTLAILALFMVFLSACNNLGSSGENHRFAVAPESISEDYFEISARASRKTPSEYSYGISDNYHFNRKAYGGTAYRSTVTSFSASIPDITFEEALLKFSTDVVIAQYAGSRPFGNNLVEFEFVVLDRVLGKAPDQIFVYAENNISVSVMGIESYTATFVPSNLTFNRKTDYMLVLTGIDSPYANTREGGFMLVHNIVIDLDTPSNSIMYNQPLSQHSVGLDLSYYVSKREIRQDIVLYVSGLTRLRTQTLPENDFIRSGDIEDIINGSPYILVVEIYEEPFRLSHEQISTDWMATDLHYVTVVQTLKGDVEVGYRFVMIFHADTVWPGEQHIIATEPTTEGSDFYRFTSRNSLFSLHQHDEIMEIINNR